MLTYLLNENAVYLENYKGKRYSFRNQQPELTANVFHGRNAESKIELCLQRPNVEKTSIQKCRAVI